MSGNGSHVAACLVDLGGTLLAHGDWGGDPQRDRTETRARAVGWVDQWLGPAAAAAAAAWDAAVADGRAAVASTGGEVDLFAITAAVLASRGLPAEDSLVADLLATTHAWWVEMTRPMAGAADFLDGLSSAGVPVVLVSNSMWPGYLVDRQVAVAGLLDRLPRRLYSSGLGLRKPRAEVFAAGLAQVGVAASQAVFVGDDWTADVAGARACGLRALWLHPLGGGGPGWQAVPDLNRAGEVLCSWLAS